MLPPWADPELEEELLAPLRGLAPGPWRLAPPGEGAWAIEAEGRVVASLAWPEAPPGAGEALALVLTQGLAQRLLVADLITKSAQHWRDLAFLQNTGAQIERHTEFGPAALSLLGAWGKSLEARGVWWLDAPEGDLGWTPGDETEAPFPLPVGELGPLLAPRGRPLIWRHPPDLPPEAQAQAQAWPEALWPLLVVPIGDLDGALGTVVVQGRPRARAWGSESLKVAQSVAGWALALSRRQQLLAMARQEGVRRSELGWARNLQAAMLPGRTAELGPWEVWGHSQAAQHVGGDFYGWLGPDQSEGGLAWGYVGDASGHGISAALMMSHATACLSVLCRSQSELGEVIAALDAQIMAWLGAASEFLTLCLWAGDADGQGLRWLGLGHPPLLVRRAEGTVELLESQGLPLGMFPQGPSPGAWLPVGPQDLVLCLTDGLWECRRRSGEVLGLEAWVDWLAALPAYGDLAALGEALLTRFQEAVAPEALDDDATLLLWRRRP